MKAILLSLMVVLVCYTVSAQEPDSTKNKDNQDSSVISNSEKERLEREKKKMSLEDQIRALEEQKQALEQQEEVEEQQKEALEEQKQQEIESKREMEKERGKISDEHSKEWEWNDGDNDKDENRQNRHFKGHWDALQIGINSYLTSDKSTSLPASYEFMALNTNKSINVNLNTFQQSFGFGTQYVGAVTGLGLEFCNFVFDNNNTIMKNPQGIIESYDPGFKLDKSKLSATYLTIPLLIEFQFPGGSRSHRLYVNAGVIGGLKLGSHTKIKYTEGGKKQSDKNRNDFNLNTFRYGFTGKIGLHHLSIFGIYYPVALFETDKGPELYPFSIGLSFDGF